MRSKDEEAVMAKQIGGTHYKEHKFQVWDIVDEYELNFYEASALKYLLRDKDNRGNDLEKAIHYCEKEILNIERIDEENKGNEILILPNEMLREMFGDIVGDERDERDERDESLLKDDEHQENIDKLSQTNTQKTLGKIYIDGEYMGEGSMIYEIKDEKCQVKK